MKYQEPTITYQITVQIRASLPDQDHWPINTSLPRLFAHEKNQKFNYVLTFASSSALFGIKRRCTLLFFLRNIITMLFFKFAENSNWKEIKENV